MNDHKKLINFITLTNSGYIDFTFNCLKSLELSNCNQNLVSYCIGKSGHELLVENGYESILIDNQDCTDEFCNTGDGKINSIWQRKFHIIHENLLSSEYVLFTDSDVVFENSMFIDYLLSNIKKQDLLIQNDIRSDEPACSGFMFIKSTSATLDLFHPKHTEKFKNCSWWGDQTYVNQILHKLNYKKLPLELFPNGKFYYNNFNKINPYIIHFNWVDGKHKKPKMKQYKKWLLID